MLFRWVVFWVWTLFNWLRMWYVTRPVKYGSELQRFTDSGNLSSSWATSHISSKSVSCSYGKVGEVWGSMNVKITVFWDDNTCGSEELATSFCSYWKVGEVWGSMNVKITVFWDDNTCGSEEPSTSFCSYWKVGEVWGSMNVKITVFWDDNTCGSEEPATSFFSMKCGGSRFLWNFGKFLIDCTVIWPIRRSSWLTGI